MPLEPPAGGVMAPPGAVFGAPPLPSPPRPPDHRTWAPPRWAVRRGGGARRRLPAVGPAWGVWVLWWALVPVRVLAPGAPPPLPRVGRWGRSAAAVFVIPPPVALVVASVVLAPLIFTSRLAS